jgi:V/A-type H+-transporting ATPase subunit F
MISYLISDNQDTLVGMKMAGVQGEIILEPEAIIRRIDELLLQPEIGLIILTYNIKNKVAEAVMERKLASKDTLIVEIPGPNQKINTDFITKYIRESIGLKL